MTWMNLVGILLSKISQTEKDKSHMTSLICGIKQKSKKQNKKTKQKLSCFDPATLASILVFLNTSHALTSGPVHLLVSGMLFS